MYQKRSNQKKYERTDLERAEATSEGKLPVLVVDHFPAV